MEKSLVPALSVQREHLVPWFGELDVLRSLQRGAAFYVEFIAQSKTNTLAFGAALLHWTSKRREPADLVTSLRTLPELLRGALVWWRALPDFVTRVLRMQRDQRYWPFDRKLVC